MKVVIPMSGHGQRFKDAGYKDIKPLIQVHGKPIIEWVLSMFPKQGTSFIFICNKEHRNSTDIEAVIDKLDSKENICWIESHKKGPVYAVSNAFDLINDDEEVIVSYCDYFMVWQMKKFFNHINTEKPEGSIVCYSGFHPHLLHEKNVYASCKVNEVMDLIEIREKYRFHSNPFLDFHSVGMYYFRRGKDIKYYFSKLIADDVSLNNEFYVSLVYNLLVQDQKRITVFDQVDYFCQWGTPQDLSEYLMWHDITKEKVML